MTAMETVSVGPRSSLDAAYNSHVSNLHHGLHTDETSDKNAYNDNDAVPDGGFKAWQQVVLLHFVCMNTWGVANGYGVFQEYYTATLGQQPSSIAWVGSIQICLLLGFGVVSGRLSDAGHFRLMFTTGVALQLLGLFTTSVCNKYWQIVLAQSLCLGLGAGFTFCPALAVTSQYFQKYRSIAVGFALVGGATGSLIYPVMLNWLLYVDGVSFGWTVRSMAFLMLMLYIPCVFFFRPRLSPRPMDKWIDVSALRETSFVLYTAGFFCMFWGLYVPFFYLGTFTRDIAGVSHPVNLLMILNGVGILGRALPVVLADKLTGTINLVIVFGFASAVMMYCWAAIEKSTSLYVFAVIYGFVGNAASALLPAGAVRMSPDPNKTGTRVGMMFGFVSIANLTGPAIAGALITEQNGQYVGAQTFAASSILVGTILVLIGRIAKTGFVWKVKF